MATLDGKTAITGQVFYADGGASLMRYPDLPALFRSLRDSAPPQG
jgi:hypothetical protein